MTWQNTLFYWVGFATTTTLLTTITIFVFFYLLNPLIEILRERSEELKYFTLGAVVALAKNDELRTPYTFKTSEKRYVIKEKEDD